MLFDVLINNSLQMLQDRFPDLVRSTFNLKVLVNASYRAKQTLASKGITPAIFLSEYYRLKLHQSLEICYIFNKEKFYKPVPQFVAIDLKQYDQFNDQTIAKYIKGKLSKCQIKMHKNIKPKTFQSKASIQSHLNNQNFHWFQQCNRAFMHFLSLDKNAFKYNTIDQPVGVSFVLQVDEKKCDEQFQSIRKETEILLKKMFKYSAHENAMKTLPIIVIILFDSAQGKTLEQANVYRQVLYRQFKIKGDCVAIVQINGKQTKDCPFWSNYSKPIFHFEYFLKPSDIISFITQPSHIQLAKVLDNHKQSMRITMEHRLDILFKKYQEHINLKNRLVSFISSFRNNPPTEKYYVGQQREIRQLADKMFLLQDYRKAYDIYKTLQSKMKDRDKQTQANITQMIHLCLGMSRYHNAKLKHDPFSVIQRDIEGLIKVYSQENMRYYLLKYIIWVVYLIHCFRSFQTNIIKTEFYKGLKICLNDKRNVLNMVTSLVHEQYASLCLLGKSIDYRHYCYELSRVGSKFMSLKLYNHALRCFHIVQLIYQGSFIGIQKYVLGQLSRVYLQMRNYPEAFNYLRQTWKVQMRRNQIQTQSNTFVANHNKILQQIQKYASQLIYETAMTNVPVPILKNINLELTDQLLQTTDKGKSKWQAIGQNFTDSTELISAGLNKIYFSKVFKQFDKTSAEDKSMVFQLNRVNPPEAQLRNASRNSYIGEQIIISFEMQNPLLNQIQIDNISFFNKNNFEKYRVIGDKVKSVIIKAGQSTIVNFTIIPEQQGFFQLEKIQWMLMKMLSMHELDIVRTNVHNCYYKINIKKPVGNLKCQLKAESLYFQGQYNTLQILLKNQGKEPITNVYASVGSEQIFGFKMKQILKQPLLPKSSCVIKLPIKIPLLQKKIKTFQINQIEKILFLYKTDNIFRCKRLTWNLNINRVAIIQDISCERISSRLHLLTFVVSHESHLANLHQLVLKHSFEILKQEKVKLPKSTIYYFFLSKALKRSIVKYTLTQKLFETKYPQQFQKELENIKDQQKLQMIFSWNSKEDDRYGYLQINPIPITFNRSLEKQPQSQKEHNLNSLPFSFKISFEQYIENDFNKNPVIEVPVQIKLKNVFSKQPITIQFFLNQLKNLDSSWEGIIRRKLVLQQAQEVVFKQNLLIMHEGIYNLAQTIRYVVSKQTSPTAHISHSDYEHLYLVVKSQQKPQNQAQIMVESTNTYIVTTDDLI